MTSTFVENWLTCGQPGLPIEVRRKLRVLNWAAGTMAAVLLGWAIMQVMYGAWPLFCWQLGLALLALGLLWLLRRSLAIVLVGHLNCLVLVVTLAVSAYYSGGFTGPNLSLLLVIPVGAVTVVGRAGLWWGIAPLVMVIGMVVAEDHGFVFPYLVPEPQRTLDGLMSWLTSIGVITFLISRYEMARHRAERESLEALHRAEAASQVRTRFISWVSRELRVPAHALLGFIDVVAQEQDASARGQLVEQARGAGRLLAALVDNVLELARAEDRQAGPTRESFSLQQVVQRVAGSLAGQLEGWGLRLQVDLAEEIPDALRGDAATLGRLLLNMLYYLGERSHGGTLCICVRPARVGKYDVQLQFDVYLRSASAAAVALPVQAVRPLLDADDQQDINVTLVRQLVDWLGGNMVVIDRQEGYRGFRFLIEFVRATPVRESSARAAVVPAGGQVEVVARKGHRRLAASPLVLVADDNAVNRHLARRLLEDLGCRVMEAGDGEQAVELFSRHDFALVLMDEQMPQLDGCRATEQIRRREQGRERRTPIVAVTAHTSGEQRDRCLEAGMDDFISKPFSRSDMQQLLQKWVNRFSGGSTPGSSGPTGPPGDAENNQAGDR